MARLRYNGLSTTLGASLTASATAVTFGAALTHSGGVSVPTISGGDYIPLTILDSTGKASEIVYLTAYTSGATSGTITRAQESTSGVSHASGDKVAHGPTVLDILDQSMSSTTQTADYTLQLADANTVVEINSATGVNVTVPPNSAAAFPIGSVVGVYQAGAGNVSVAAGAGVTVRNLAPLSGQYAEASLRKRATDEWVLAGSIASAVAPSLKDYAEVMRTAGDVSLNATAVTPVSTSLDLVIAASAGDLVSYGISGLLSATAQAVVFDVYTMPSGSTVNPFGAGLSSLGSPLQGVSGWEVTSGNGSTTQMSGEITRVLTSADVAGGVTTLRLLYAKANTTARVLFANTNIPLKVWAKNHGQV